MSYFPCVGAGGLNEDLFSITSLTCMHARTHSHKHIHAEQMHSSIKQCVLIKRSHYTQEEIPAGAVYQSLVHFLLLLLFLALTSFSLSYPYLLPALFTSLTTTSAQWGFFIVCMV